LRFVVVGGGIGGIQVSLDLAEMGYEVDLIEKGPSIGGIMALLDKTFPTMDCSICILSPKMVEAYRHPRIHIYTLSEVVALEGSPGRFRVRVLRRPRYVDEVRCVACGICAEKCPMKVPDPYLPTVSHRKAIYRPFPEAVPPAYLIDPERCLYLTRGACRLCEEACEAGAIDFQQREERVTVEAAAVIIATGLKPYNPEALKEYRYRKFEDVITALELERMMAATGPTGGRLIRPSTGQTPSRIGFIQCVGSRSLRGGYPYCSAVCCMHATKEAIMLKERNPDAEIYIFYTDIRDYGKGFLEFIERARERYGVHYIRARPSDVRRDPENGRLKLRYENSLTGEMEEVELDLIVLSTALRPSGDNERLAEILGVEVDEYGFFRRPDPILKPFDTTRKGIYICGYAREPMDIPRAVADASGAVCRALELLGGGG
jgi:heterodisulfide reductase subunit A